jgi:hypothetical protein
VQPLYLIQRQQVHQVLLVLLSPQVLAPDL